MTNYMKHFLTAFIGTILLITLNTHVRDGIHNAKLIVLEAVSFYIAIGYSSYMAQFVLEKQYIKEEESKEEQEHG